LWSNISNVPARTDIGKLACFRALHPCVAIRFSILVFLTVAPRFERPLLAAVAVATDAEKLS
jgi:hypothetical protein